MVGWRRFREFPVVVAVLALIALFASVAPSARAHAAADPVEMTLESSSGGNRALSSYRGKVVVLFYEDRHHTDTNARVKEAVARYGQEHQLQDKVAVVAVANLKGYDFNPASAIARRAIRAIAARVGIEILMDWRGVAIDTLGVEDANANVVVLDRGGVVRFRAAGRLGAPDEKALLNAVSASL